MLFEFEKNVLLWIQDNIRCDAFTGIMKFFSGICDKGILWIIIALILVFNKKYRRVGWINFIVLVLSLIVCNIVLKNLVARPRPYDRIEELVLLGNKLNDLSFPSGHTTAAFASVIVYLKTMSRKFSIPMLVVAIIVAFSRLYLGAHYLTDVLSGVVIGVVLGILAVYIEELCYNKIKQLREEQEKVE